MTTVSTHALGRRPQIYIVSPEQGDDDLDALLDADVVLTDAPLDPVAAMLAWAARIPVRPLSDLVGDAV